MGAETLARVPRLELSLAITMAGIGVVLASISERLGLLPLTWEPPLFAAVGGALAGQLVRRHCLQGEIPETGDARKTFLRNWILLGGAAGGLVCLAVRLTLPGFIPPTITEGVVIGGLLAVVVYPACQWLLRQSRVAVRARLGSIVAAADRRAIWSVTAVVLALASLAGLVELSEAPIMIALVGSSISLFVFIADRHDRNHVRGLIVERQAMDVLTRRSDDDVLSATDLGVGEELAGRTEAGATYRAEGRRVPLLRGSILRARIMLDRCHAASSRRLGVVFSILLVHVLSLT
jgi:hypothetical protein